MKLHTLIAFVASALALGPVFPAVAQRNEAGIVESAIEVFQALRAVPEKGIPDWMMKNTQGIAIIPGVTKAAFVVGGQYGSGVLVVKDAKGGWGSPIFITLKGGSVGWQIGVQSIDLVLFFRTKSSVDGVLEGGNFTLGVDVSVAAGSLGRAAGASTDTDLQAEIFSYSRSRGLFAGLMIAGVQLKMDEDADAAYYGKPNISAADIISGRGIRPPASAADLSDVLNKYTASVGD
jgi:lipid-binding SYLF domain-containing protein